MPTLKFCLHVRNTIGLLVMVRVGFHHLQSFFFFIRTLLKDLKPLSELPAKSSIAVGPTALQGVTALSLPDEKNGRFLSPSQYCDDHFSYTTACLPSPAKGRYWIGT